MRQVIKNMSNAIQNLNVESEWTFLNVELLEHKPTTAPFSEEVVRAREILLKLQVLLSAYANEENAQRKKEFEEKYLQSKNAYLQLAYRK